MWQILEPPKKAEKTRSVKLGTVTRHGRTKGQLSFGGAIIGDANACSISVDLKARKLQIVFGAGPFKIQRIGSFGKGGRVILPQADWLPPTCFRALPVEVESRNGNTVIVALPENWPDPPAQTSGED